MKSKIEKYFLVVSITIGINANLFAQCENEPILFVSVPAKQSGLTFNNKIIETASFNFLTHNYIYNGGGVAIGDINNDGLQDVFLSGNMEDSKLYLNKGGFRFDDITKKAGIQNKKEWASGVTMIDINADGFLDIYVCYSGKGDPDKRRNKLYINQGNATFVEKAKEFNLDDPSYSVQAAFLDYDHDGDLDMYLLNYNIDQIAPTQWEYVRKHRDPYAGDKLYKNNKGVFEDVSEEAGIKGHALGYGLGIAVSDLNQDGWPDIYISNDYIEPDYMYINNKDGTFSDKLTDYFQHVSHFSMGSDISDINNDLYPDLFTLDMLPEDNKRQKLLYGPDNYEENSKSVSAGYYHQNMRNMLQLNNANGTFSEVGQLSGISNTDWSWSSLFADFDNDGFKDLLITNGYLRDVTNRDYMKFRGDYYFQSALKREKPDTLFMVNSTTSTPLHNYVFKNQDGINFVDKTTCWGLEEPTFSNGSAFADLDNDGDLDIVINNINRKATLYKNTTRENGSNTNFVQFSLIGATEYATTVGTKIIVSTGNKVQYYEWNPTRGFQSSISPVIHFGLGAATQIDSVQIIWPDQYTTILKEPTINKLHVVKKENTNKILLKNTSIKSTQFSKIELSLSHQHIEYPINDFKRQPLLLTMLTQCGPTMAVADVDKNGTDDILIGSSKQNLGQLYLQDKEGNFTEGSIIGDIRMSTDAAASFVDIDDDGDVDLYLASGGYHDYQAEDKFLQDRIFINDGNGNFTYNKEALPKNYTSNSTVSPSDFDHDGDIDLFVGARVVPGKYPTPPQSILLTNDGNGIFTEASIEITNGLRNIGMVTASHWADVNNDGWEDLILIGEFMPITIFENQQGRLLNATHKYFNKPLKGLWSSLKAGDFDNDGDTDLIVGNFGTNTQLTASEAEPLTLFYADFDNNGSIDPFLGSYRNGKLYPFASREEFVDQVFSMRQKFVTYESYANAELKDILPPEFLKQAATLTANTLETIYLENENNQFTVKKLPKEAQFSPVYAITVNDFNNDGNMDFILSGNQSYTRIKLGRIDSNFGSLFFGDGNGGFEYVPQNQSGLNIHGDVRSVETIQILDNEYLIFGINNSKIETYRIQK